jgi:hypothetical protein
MPSIGAPELLILLPLLVVFVVLTAWLAAKKGYSPAVWAILGFFFSWIALIIVLVLPNRLQGPPPGDSSGGSSIH